MNSQLVDKKFAVPEEILRNISFSLHKYSDGGEGVKRAKFIRNNRYCTYQMLKGLKHFFDNPESMKSREQYELAGGDAMKFWVNHTLDQSRASTKQQGKKELTASKDTVSSLRPQNISADLGLNESEETQHEYVICLLFNTDNEILMLKRREDDVWMGGKWGFLGGTMEGEESPIDAAKREIKEEVNIIPTKLVEKFSIKRENQTEYIFMGVVPENSDIKLDDENDDYKFVTVNELDSMDTVPNVLDYIRIVLDSSEYTEK